MSQLRFDEKMVEGLERLYATRDVLRRRALVHDALDAQSGDRVFSVGPGNPWLSADRQDFVW